MKTDIRTIPQRLFRLFALVVFFPSSSLVWSADTTTGLVARYPLEGNGTDASGLGKDLTATAISYSASTSGGQAATFNGQNSSFRYPAAITTSNPFSWTCWFRVDPDVSFSTGSVKLMNQGGDPGSGGVSPALDILPDRRLRFSTYTTQGNDLLSAAEAVTLGVWHFAAVTSDPSGNRVLYLNGSSVANASGHPFGQFSPNFYLGGAMAYGHHNMLKGALDDVRIYSRALAQTDVTALMNAGPNTDAVPPSNVGLICWMRFDGNVIDSTNSCYADTSFVPDPDFTTDTFRGRIARFHGRDGYLTLRPRSHLSPRTDDYSVAAWIKWPQRQAGETDQPLAAIFTAFNMVRPGAAGATWVQLTGDTVTGRMQFGLRPGAGNGSQTVTTGTSNVRTGQWAHVVGVRRGQHTVEIWVNGIKEGQLINTSLTDVNLEAIDSYGQLDPTAPAVIGYNPGYTGADFRGWMDDLRIYRRALSASEITQMAAGSFLEVTNVRAQQGGFGSKHVDIHYDLGTSNPFLVSVSLEISADGGQTWNIPAQSVTGDIGSNIALGNGKTIRWNAGLDWNLQASDTMRFRVVAVQSGKAIAGESANTPIDTLDSSNAITITIHRLTANAFNRLDWRLAHLHEDIKTDAAILRTQPTVQGVIADGVTPLLLRVYSERNFETPWSMRIQKDPNPETLNDLAIDLRNRFFFIKNGEILGGEEFNLSNDAREVFIVVLPFDSVSDHVGPMFYTDNGISYAPSVTLGLYRRTIQWDPIPRKAAITFMVRRPPIALVHGYNADNRTWSGSFLAPLRADRGDDFVIPVEYGTDWDNGANTYGTLLQLAFMLGAQLKMHVEDGLSGRNGSSPLAQWAGTNYDVTGHSQGGVLLRLLCSASTDPTDGRSLESFGWEPFRSRQNHYKGRFHRVVTLGSPHYGSTLGYVGRKMLDHRLWHPVKVGPLRLLIHHELVVKKLDRLLRDKFFIESSYPDSIAALNKIFVCDDAAQLHLVGSTIYSGQAPPLLIDDNLPNIYRSLWIEGVGDKWNTGPSWRDPVGPGVTSKTSGELLAPFGSDGVVDLRSQIGLPSSVLATNWPAAWKNRSIVVGSNIAHASVPFFVATDTTTDATFGTSDSQTASSSVASHILGKLNTSDAAAFARFQTPLEMAALREEMDHAAERLVEFVSEVDSKNIEIPQLLAIQTQNQTTSSTSNPMSVSANSAMNTSSWSTETFNYTFQAASGHSRSGVVSWSARVYGSQGATDEGITLTTSGDGDTILALTVDAAVVGQVVLDVSYLSTTGQVVSGQAILVTTRFPGPLQAVELRPGTLDLSPGGVVPLTLWGHFGDGSELRLFESPSTTAFSTSQSSVATVNGDGVVSLVAPGSCTIQATYNGSLNATTSVTVKGPAPSITSANTVSGNLGVPLSHNVTATGSGLAFSAEGLPDGLAMSTSGIITGTPGSEGQFPAAIRVTNSEGTSSLQTLTFVIAATNQPPTAISLTAASAPAAQPAGTAVGSLVTTDSNPLDSFTYSLVPGSGADQNGLFSITGNVLSTAAPLIPSTTPQCSIRVRSQDSGGASVEQVLVLPVLGAPVITQPPAGFSIYVAEEAQLLVGAEGYGALAFQWLKNGVEISGATSQVLTITGTDVGADNYQARVSNSYGQIVSSAALVTTQPKTFGRWSAERSAGSTLMAANGDINGDGIANAFDFVFGTDPSQTRGVMPKIEHRAGAPAFIYRLAANIEVTRLRVMVSNNLTNWQEHVPAVGEVVSHPNPDGSTEIEVRLPFTDPRLFFQLEVTL